MHRRILIIDASTLLYSAKFSLGKKNLTYKKIETGIIYGFLLKLQLIVSTISPNITVFAIDSKKSKRKKIYPEYKLNRHQNKTQEEIDFDQAVYEQFNTVTTHVLPTLGYRNNFKVSGLEADDIIASICLSYRKKDEIVIVSDDGDLYQLLRRNVSMFLPKTNKYFTKKDFIQKYGIPPKKWNKVKKLAGCSSDKVAGIKGVGIKKAILYVKNELPSHHKSFQAIESPEGKKIVKRNKKLIHLPFPNTPKFRLRPNKIRSTNIKKVAEEYGLNSLLTDTDSWYRKLRDR
jgi:DNA polymerase-1